MFQSSRPHSSWQCDENKHQQPDSDTSAHCPRVYHGPCFNLPGLTVAEKSVTKNFNVWKLERKKNEEIKGRISTSSLIPLHTIHLPTVHVCTKFQSSRSHSSWQCDENFNLKGYGMTEWQSQNHRITEGQGKSSVAPTFSKRGYNNGFFMNYCSLWYQSW